MIRQQRGVASNAGSRKVTIRDVASSAGVSTATVSYVLNGTPGQTITERTSERVRLAAASLGYAPHGIARTLREGKSRIVLLNIGSLVGGNSLDSFITGMADELRRLDHTLFVTTDRGSAGGGVPAEVLDAVAPRAVLDLARIATASRGDDDMFGVVDGHQAGLAFHTLTQLRHLAERGHREIAFAIPDDAGVVAAARAEHASRAAHELGLGPIRVVRIDMKDDQGRRETVRGLVENTPVTAVAAYSDDVALGVLAALSGLGLQAPADLAVIGFDEERHGRLWLPALSTVRINAEAFGCRAARVALGLDPGVWIEAPSEVVVREST